MTNPHRNGFPVWVEYLRKRPNPAIRLLCLPYGGASALVFRDWHAALPEFVEVWPIQLPGRGRRFAEPPFQQASRAVDALESAVLREMDRPYALYGFSMGAVLAFELARRAECKGHPPPAHLFVGGRGAPHLPPRTAPTYDLPHDEFVRELRDLGSTPEEILSDPQLLDFFMPTIRADFELAQTYTARPAPPLTCPLTVFGGENDRLSPPQDLSAWKAHTSNSCRVEIYTGGHFFVRDYERQVLNVIKDELTRTLEESAEPVALSATGTGG